MSYVFEVGGDTVWSPALSVGETFVGFADRFAELAGVESGLVPIANDMIEIDLEVFELFTRRLFDDYFRSAHPAHRDLLRGVLLVALVVLGRAGRAVDAVTDEQREVLELAASRARTMAM